MEARSELPSAGPSRFGKWFMTTPPPLCALQQRELIFPRVRPCPEQSPMLQLQETRQLLCWRESCPGKAEQKPVTTQNFLEFWPLSL